jgi:hypothetical protein
MTVAKRTALVAGLCGLLFSGVTRAEPLGAQQGGVNAGPQSPAPDLEKARAHFLQGVQFYNAGDFKLSLIEFRRSYEISQNYRILYNIGQVNQQLGNYTNALLALERYLREGAEEIEDARRTEVVANTALLRKRVAHVRVICNVPTPEILVDGFPVEASTANATLTVDPGDHRLDLRKPGYQPGSTVVALAAGDTSEVRLNLARIPQGTRLTLAPSAPHARRNTTWLWLGWTTTAATAVGAGITGVLATAQASELADLRNSSWSTQAQRDNVGSRAKNLALTSDILAGTAVLAGVASLYLTLQPGSEPEQRQTSVTRVALSPAGVRIERSF